MAKNIADIIVGKLDDDHISKVKCTYSYTTKGYLEQFWYQCKTCWPTVNNGCCVSCAVTCHKGHDLSELKYSRFFCDCAPESNENRTCKLYRKHEYPGSKLPKVKLGGYGQFVLKDGVDGLVKLETCLHNRCVTHYTFVSEGRSGRGTVVFVEWIDQRSNDVFDDVQELSALWSKSSESRPEGTVMVWSEADKKYLSCGPVDEY